MPQSLRTTQLLILRKTAYSDTSLVVAGVSPDHGQLHFLVRGARRISRTQQPNVDLLRVLDISFRSGRGGLGSWSSAEPALDFRDIARDYAAYQAALWLVSFALKNTHPEMPCPLFFRGLLVALERLERCTDQEDRAHFADWWTMILVGVLMVYLDENGLLPDIAHGIHPQRLDVLQEVGIGKRRPPKLAGDVWRRLRDWAVNALRYSECVVPDLPSL